MATGSIAKTVTVNIPSKGRNRRYQKPEWSAERERVALELVIAGASYKMIAEALDCTEGAAWRITKRALEKRAKDIDSGTVEAARALFVSRLELLFSKWMPLATGEFTGIPDKDAADQVLKILDRLARFLIPSSGPTVELNQTTIVTVESMRDQVMRSLDEVAARQEIIDGTLA